MTKEEIEQQMGRPVSELADICNCKDQEWLVMILSLAITVGSLQGMNHTHKWYFEILKGAAE